MKKLLTLTLALALILSCAACGGPDSTSASEPVSSNGRQVTGHINVYTSEPQDLVTDMLDDFVAKNPGVTYDLFRSGTGDVTAKMDAELATGSTEADVIWFADIAYICKLDEKGLIEHYTPAAASEIDSSFNYRDGMAWEVRQIFNIIAYNTLNCPIVPADWFDLTKAELAGKFAMANPAYSGGAFTALVAHVDDENVGWKLYEGYKANDVKFAQSNGDLQNKVASGEYSAVAIVDFMARNSKNDGSPVEVVWPESGAVMIPTPVAMMSTVAEENKAACQAFIDYLLSEDGQKFFVEQGYIPVSPSAGVPEGAPGVDEINASTLDIDFFVENGSAIKEQFIEMFPGN